jgi:glycosyltransferase involved in cell wall biosynthesis
MRISIIITARNNGQYLSECIDSCLKQTIKPFDIIYSDDCSTDDSLDVAGKYRKDIVIVPHKKHLGVVGARNSGADISKGDVLVFLDGDDILPPDFLEKHLQVFDKSTPFVYCAAKCFGTSNHFWDVHAWGTDFLWNRNFVNTSAIMWRSAFEKAGGWQETCVKTMWDWSLALRLSRLGTPRKSPAILMYRQHPDSWSHANEKKNGYSNFQTLTESIRRELVKVTVGLIYSGRIEGFMDKWMKQLVEDIEILSNKPELIVINNSEKPLDLHGYEKYFSEIKIITGSGKLVWKDEMDRRNKVCELLSDGYNMILEHATGELIHLREDDILPLKGSFQKIYNLVTEGNPVREAVAGIYLNRNPKYQRIVGGFYNEEIPRNTQDLTEVPTKEPFIIDYTGNGFMIFWKALVPMFSPRIDGIQAQDWSHCLKIKKMGGKVWMDPSAICRHYHSMTEYVEYNPSMDITPANTFTRPATYGNIIGRTKSITIKKINTV